MDPAHDAATVVIIGGIVLAGLLWLWNYYLHDLLTETAHRTGISPLAGRLLSIVSFLAALAVLWLLAGISVLTYLQALLAIFTR
ncbi:MAG: hypothetical protein AB1916_15120 [Thermodesulfobacteriota bacterium]